MRDLLEPECEVVATVEDGRAALNAVSQYRPDLVLVDVSLPNMNGFAVLEALRQSHPEIRVMMVTAHAEPAYLKRAFELGASAYLTKGAIRMELLAAVREVLRGGRYSSDLLRHL